MSGRVHLIPAALHSLCSLYQNEAITEDEQVAFAGLIRQLDADEFAYHELLYQIKSKRYELDNNTRASPEEMDTKNELISWLWEQFENSVEGSLCG